ncbi:myo inositol monophosphatase [Coprinopsis cinerea okayama7|uniref:Inositol-1-monophosphatase n=1 Tax=Coprinopsis cinerea (strain Okayama-7 / 130 / ATCC MYA-4618 / FGSC 9003) TaxID=240176 RepID=A8N3K1_COPC7|nr:myo inositol monophosphatase [Coprinopsis cinerea okayama7\|eukprot:XP_001829441.1 myo inositol monophosphatase [Coprinopsis cinerea okayama7\
MSDYQKLTPTEYKPILDFIVTVARKAGALILEGSAAIQTVSSQETGVNEKKNSVDLVTEYDVRVEELLLKELKNGYPNFKFIGEESYSAGKREPLTDDPTFCVDPIDGTTNFVHGIPFVCVSIGVIYERRPIIGVIYNPFLDHLYTAAKSHGAYLTRNNGTPQRLPLASPPKPLSSLHGAVIGVEWGSERSSESMAGKSSSFVKLAGDPERGVPGGKMAHSLRSFGSGALNCAMVAQGALDMYWEIGCWPWDVSAGIIIVQEAGGIITGSHKVLSDTINAEQFGDVTEDILFGRKYLLIRGIADTPTESGRDAQKRLLKEFYDTVVDVEPQYD